MDLGVVHEEHREEFFLHTSPTKRTTVNFAPGVSLRWRLPLDEAAVLDESDELETVVRAALEECALALKLELPW